MFQPTGLLKQSGLFLCSKFPNFKCETFHSTIGISSLLYPPSPVHRPAGVYKLPSTVAVLGEHSGAKFMLIKDKRFVSRGTGEWRKGQH